LRTIGVIGGLSWESTALYYRFLNERARERLGGLHSARLLLWSFDFAEVERLQAEGDWECATTLMADAARRLAAGGADLLVIASNTMHRMADTVETAGGVPLIHIADATAAAAKHLGVTRPALLATRHTMEQPFYKGRLRDRHGLDAIVPDAGGRELVHRVIYEELCLGRVLDTSREAYRDAMAALVERGAEAILLGCTEIDLLVGADDSPVPVFDTTRLHAERAVELAA
jgi:aspartate racemase